MQLTIHRGSHQIGGSCVELSTQNTTILIDLGSPLDETTSKPININFKNKAIDAVLISHPHQDHYGQISLLPPAVPVYIGNLSKPVLDAIATFTNHPHPQNAFRFFERGKPFVVGDLTITPFLVDHSANDAYCFLIEAEGKTLVYSGDFRDNGYKGFLLEDVIKKLKGKSVDVLIMEGTSLEREPAEFPQEKDVAKEIERIITKQSNASFLVASSTNFDRMISASLACDKAGKILVVDIYTAWIMELMKTISKKEPLLDRPHVKVLANGKYAKKQYVKIQGDPHYQSFCRKIYAKPNNITLEEIKATPEKCLIKMSEWVIDKMTEEITTAETPVQIIYSMWKYPSYERLKILKNTTFHYAHTSGHATLEVLKKYAHALSPKKLIPIHTETPSLFKEHFQNVVEVEDGKTIEI